MVLATLFGGCFTVYFIRLVAAFYPSVFVCFFVCLSLWLGFNLLLVLKFMKGFQI